MIILLLVNISLVYFKKLFLHRGKWQIKDAKSIKEHFHMLTKKSPIK